jgi:hypothetical protein
VDDVELDKPREESMKRWVLGICHGEIQMDKKYDQRMAQNRAESTTQWLQNQQENCKLIWHKRAEWDKLPTMRDSV